MSLFNLLSIKLLAHCPLCTAGAGAAAAAAALLGVRYGSIGVFMGAFAAALGLWLGKKVKKRFKFQETVLFWIIYLSTLIPLYPLLRGDYTSKYVSLGGEYGSWLNRTYLIDLFIVGAVLGIIIIYISPQISTYLTKIRKEKTLPFQGLFITFLLLIITGVIMQVWPR